AGKGTSPGPEAAPEKTKAAVAASSGPITVHRQVSDQEIQQFLARFLPKYPGVRTTPPLRVRVDTGVVTIDGQVDDDDSRDEITDVVKRVEGVRLVLNQLKTDEEVMTGWGFAVSELTALGNYLARKWILILLALAIVLVSWLLAQFFASRSETLLAPFVRNVLLRSVVGSIISSLLIVGGLMLALGTLRLTHLVLSVLGISGLVVLAVSFAFKDVTENFIASVLLGLRRPFQIGDYVTIAGQSGVVKSLNTRATVLVTLEGNHVRIPNATIFKEILVNATASPSARNSFDVVIPLEASTADALDAMNRALRETKGILPDPSPRALVEALEPGGVRIRAYFWSPSQGVDAFQLQSDAKLKAKVALQQAGVLAPAAAAAPAGKANGHAATAEVQPAPPSVTGTTRQAAANLRRDAQAAESAPSAVGNGRKTLVQRVLQEPETRVSEEGANLLKDARSE
ncbi:MAG TPA: mechanosensitive ion channel domain-containing protein, partial [Isosphaeraceae bacterium]|nr:mechanosensitive ion channel domain-containing protein [Isosphaeraceae bacterium]